MALRGKIISLGTDKFGFEYSSTELSNPIRIRQIWEINAYRMRATSYCEPKDVIGHDATITDGRVSSYLGNGNWFEGTLENGGQTKSILSEQIPIPAPKVRANTETRWQSGRWEKYTRKGWIAA